MLSVHETFVFINSVSISRNIVLNILNKKYVLLVSHLTEQGTCIPIGHAFQKVAVETFPNTKNR